MSRKLAQNLKKLLRSMKLVVGETFKEKEESFSKTRLIKKDKLFNFIKVKSIYLIT